MARKKPKPSEPEEPIRVEIIFEADEERTAAFLQHWIKEALARKALRERTAEIPSDPPR
jgi:acetylornithine deacetylase/succinyl-diaminopimelate desuccinylase-like protein